jgi:hypothetical protein
MRGRIGGVFPLLLHISKSMTLVPDHLDIAKGQDARYTAATAIIGLSISLSSGHLQSAAIIGGANGSCLQLQS